MTTAKQTEKKPSIKIEANIVRLTEMNFIEIVFWNKLLSIQNHQRIFEYCLKKSLIKIQIPNISFNLFLLKRAYRAIDGNSYF